MLDQTIVGLAIGALIGLSIAVGYWMRSAPIQNDSPAMDCRVVPFEHDSVQLACSEGNPPDLHRPPADSGGFITTQLDDDNCVFWARDYSGIIEVSMHDGRRFRFDVVNGAMTGTPRMIPEENS
jgi:hypothetical protein